LTHERVARETAENNLMTRVHQCEQHMGAESQRLWLAIDGHTHDALVQEPPQQEKIYLREAPLIAVQSPRPQYNMSNLPAPMTLVSPPTMQGVQALGFGSQMLVSTTGSMSPSMSAVPAGLMTSGIQTPMLSGVPMVGPPSVYDEGLKVRASLHSVEAYNSGQSVGSPPTASPQGSHRDIQSMQGHSASRQELASRRGLRR